MAVNFAGHLYNDAGTAISGASVKLLETGTTTQEGSTVTTDSDGAWAFTESDQDRYDVEITSGSSVRNIRWDDQISLKELDVRNNTGATTPAMTLTNINNATANQVAVFSGANSTKADNDEIYLSFKLADSAGNIDEFARMTVVATDVTSGTEDGQIEFDVIKAGTLTNVWTLTSSASAAMSFDMNVDSLTFGAGADTDITLTFDANSADGVITWMEDEDYFKFSDGILMATTEQIFLRDDAIYIYSSADGQLDLVADTELGITAPTVDIDASTEVNISTDLKVGDDLSLTSDSSVFNMGAGNDFTITHDGTTGATLAGNPITITASGASTWSTSSGALTVTSAAAATWSTAAGVLTIDGDDGIVMQNTGSGNITLAPAGQLILGSATGVAQMETNGLTIGLASSAPAPQNDNVTIWSGSGATTTPSDNAQLTLENNNATYLQFLPDEGYNGGILVGDDSDVDAGRILYNNDNDDWDISTGTGSTSSASQMIIKNGSVDIKNNELLNVGSADSNWETNKITQAGGSGNQEVRIETTGSSAASILRLVTPNAGTGVNAIVFAQGDGDGQDDHMGYNLRYDGANGQLELNSTSTTGTAGQAADIWRIPDGQLTMDFNSTTDESAFDDYDDAMVLKRAFSPEYRGGRDLMRENRQELIDMGVLRQYDDGFVGYSDQRMAALLAGGIYQTRQRVDELDERIAALEAK